MRFSHLFISKRSFFSHYHVSLREPKKKERENIQRGTKFADNLVKFISLKSLYPAVLIFPSMTARTSSRTVWNISRRRAILTSECQADFYNSQASSGESSLCLPQLGELFEKCLLETLHTLSFLPTQSLPKTRQFLMVSSDSHEWCLRFNLFLQKVQIPS